MNTILKDVRNIDCFIYIDRIYIPSNVELMCEIFRRLPTFSSKYEQLLIDNNISYNKLENGKCEIYDKNCYDYYELTLPVYVYDILEEIYIPTRKEHTVQVITKESFTAAFHVKWQVESLIFDYNINELAKKVKALLDKNTIAFIPLSSPIIPELVEFQFELCVEYRYFLFERRSKGGFGRCFGYVIVDLKAIEGKSILALNIPEDFAGLIIGNGGRNIQNLINDINKLKSIHINGINVHKIVS